MSGAERRAQRARAQSAERDDLLPEREAFVAQQKAALRLWARQVRAGLPEASEAICAQLEPFIAAQGARVVLAYHAFRREPDLTALVDLMPEVRFLTTRVAGRGHLTLHDFASATLPNRFGILEPPADTPGVEPEAVDLVLVPGLVFTRAGARLGYGGGFYDRLLPQLRPDAPRVGVCREALLVDALPLEPWDVLMTHLCTESGLGGCTFDRE